MLGLEIREEFKGRKLKGTAIELSNSKNTGATQVSAQDFLGITYPTHDVLVTLESIAPDQGRPVTLIGERGQGKSHLLAVIYHALTDQSATNSWLEHWAGITGNEKIKSIPLRNEMVVISESLHRQNYGSLWDLLFSQHPNGQLCKGMWEAGGESKTNVPSEKILMEMFNHTPTAIILDEFQTWFDGLTNTKQHPHKNWAFNFIQLLSEISTAHPDKLMLVVSVRNSTTDAYQQIQRVQPIIVDFKGPSAKTDRLNLLLHRLFQNRLNVSKDEISKTVASHADEYIRLKAIPPSEHDKTREDFVRAWPYAPHLMALLEDQILISTHAQETRDLIRILAELFKRSGDKRPILTAADFNINDEKCGISTLLDSFANAHHSKLREKAQRNLEAVQSALTSMGKTLKYPEEIISSLWLRSLADNNLAGADQAILQVDITREKPVDDNTFTVELDNIVENSFNIHKDGERYLFKEEENPQAKLIASARNDRLFKDGEDLAHLAKETRYVIGGTTEVANRYKVIVMPQFWQSKTVWDTMVEEDQPSRWDERLVLLVLPEAPKPMEAKLGSWLKESMQNNRNAVRFLIPKEGTDNLFSDRDLIVMARAIYLADQWRTDNSEYGKLHTKYQKELRGNLKSRFDRYAVIETWNFQEPSKCTFSIEGHKAEGDKIPEAIDRQINENLFMPEDFEERVLEVSPNNESVGKFLKELREPLPGGKYCIPWLGETILKEKLIGICAKGKISINLRGMETLQRKQGEDEDDARRRMKGKLGTGKHLDETFIQEPEATPEAGTVTPPTGGGDGGGSETPPVGTPPVTPPGGGTFTPPTGGGGTPPGGGIFGGGGGAKKKLTADPTSSLNLMGKVETWGISTGTQLENMNLKIGKLTGAQLQELLKKLPDGMQYELDVEKEEN